MHNLSADPHGHAVAVFGDPAGVVLGSEPVMFGLIGLGL